MKVRKICRVMKKWANQNRKTRKINQSNKTNCVQIWHARCNPAYIRRLKIIKNKYAGNLASHARPQGSLFEINFHYFKETCLFKEKKRVAKLTNLRSKNIHFEFKGIFILRIPLKCKDSYERMYATTKCIVLLKIESASILWFSQIVKNNKNK